MVILKTEDLVKKFGNFTALDKVNLEVKKRRGLWFYWT